MTSSPASEPKPVAVPPGRLRLPGRVPLVIMALCLVVIAVVRGSELVQDLAIVNVLTLVFSFIICVTLTAWFSLGSGLSSRVRIAGVLAVLGVIVLFFTFFKIARVSGELVPEFRPRFETTSTFPFLRLARKPDEFLETPAPTPPAADAALEAASPYDYPGFLGPNRSTGVDWPAVKLAHDWSAQPPREVWREKIGAGWSAFAISGGLAFTLEQRGENELVTCYATDTGKLVWSQATKARHETELGAAGPRSTPTVAEGYVYTLGATGSLYCFKAATGAVVWQQNLFEMYGLTPAESEKMVAWGRSNSPLVVGDLAIVPGARTAAGEGAALVAFERQTGKKVWENGTEQVSYASPELGTLGGLQQILIVNEQSVTGHDLVTGRELWRQPWPGHSNADANAAQAHAVAGDRVFVSKGYSSGSALFSVKQNAGEWTTADIWSNRALMKTKFTNVAIYNGYVYGLSDGMLECIALDTGDRQWKKGRYRQGQILRVNDLLIVQAESGEVFLVAADPAAQQELGRIPALAGQTWNNPSIFCRTRDGALHCYLLTRNAEEAACYELPLDK